MDVSHFPFKISTFPHSLLANDVTANTAHSDGAKERKALFFPPSKKPANHTGTAYTTNNDVLGLVAAASPLKRKKKGTFTHQSLYDLRLASQNRRSFSLSLSLYLSPPLSFSAEEE